MHRIARQNDVPVLYTENWPKSTAVITGVILRAAAGPGGAGSVFSLDAAALVYFATIAPLDAYLAL